MAEGSRLTFRKYTGGDSPVEPAEERATLFISQNDVESDPKVGVKTSPGNTGGETDIYWLASEENLIEVSDSVSEVQETVGDLGEAIGSLNGTFAGTDILSWFGPWLLFNTSGNVTSLPVTEDWKGSGGDITVANFIEMFLNFFRFNLTNKTSWPANVSFTDGPLISCGAAVSGAVDRTLTFTKANMVYPFYLLLVEPDGSGDELSLKSFDMVFDTDLGSLSEPTAFLVIKNFLAGTHDPQGGTGNISEHAILVIKLGKIQLLST